MNARLVPAGLSIIAGRQADPDPAGKAIRAVNPATDAELEPTFRPATDLDVDAAVQAATAAFDDYRNTSPAIRALFLRAIADNLDARRADLVERAGLETGLPQPRLNGEVTRTINQLRLFAAEVELGQHQDVRIDHAQPERAPIPAPDLRHRRIGLGPVLVFGASNFPFAFSTAGGDTASALSAGCPVIMKAHNSHAGTAELTAWAIADAIAQCDLPPGTFSLIYGPGASIGQRLAAHPGIKAIAFTGSRSGGTALMKTAARRPEPIPVYAEMSSINPVILLPGAWTDTPDEFIDGLIGSLTMGAGQFCTNPGLVLAPSAHLDNICDRLSASLSGVAGQTMLSPSIAAAYTQGIARLAAADGARRVGTGIPGDTRNSPPPAIFSASAEAYMQEGDLQDEVFGSAAVVVPYDDVTALCAILESLEGQLTANVHAGQTDRSDVARLLPILERKAGRLTFNSWPTGVEVNHAMVHGGPFPATSDTRTTSVGSAAILRFQRPVAYQNFPDDLLPDAVAQDNPWELPRRLDGAI